MIDVTSAGAVSPIMVNSTLDQAAGSPGSTTCSSTGDLCTLRAAIDAANSGGGAGVIDVPDGHYVLTIAAASPDNDLTGDLNITGNVTIVGDVANPGGVVIDANGNSRVFEVDPGGTASISGVTITNGNPNNDGAFSDFNGGGIDSFGALTLSHSVVTANVAAGLGNGAGIDMEQTGALTLDSVTVSDNGTAGTTNDGGGIELATGTSPTDTIQNSTISGNTAFGDGGGIHQSDTSTLDVTNTVISGNTTGARGGGFYDNNNVNANPNGTVTFTDDTISNNNAADGGGVYNDHGSNITFGDSTISGNVAGASGGGGFDLEGSPSIVDIIGSTISGNSTTGGGKGGGIENDACDTLTLTNDTLAANTASGAGGGFYGDTSNSEGGACAAGQGISFLFDTVSGNTAATGGGDVDLQASAALTLTDSIAAGGDPVCVVGAPASLTSGGYNLYGDASCGSPAGTDFVGQDPQLGALANNGGPTLTELPGGASPAVGAIPAAVCSASGVASDQRGVTRGTSGGCTIGAVEVGVANNGYRMAGGDGGVFDFNLNFNGSLANVHLAAPIVGLANAPGVNGYLLVGRDGGVFALGGAAFFGSLGATRIPSPISAIASTPAEDGYWLAAQNGTIYNFGNTPAFPAVLLPPGGALPTVQLPPGAHVVGIASTSTGKGVWVVDNFGDVYALGDAPYLGGMGGVRINAPVVGISSLASGFGYVLAGSDGGVYTFGVGFAGSVPGSLQPGQHLVAPIVGIALTHDGRGYWLAGGDGGLFNYGDATFYGSIYTAIPGRPLNAPIVGIEPLGTVLG